MTEDIYDRFMRVDREAGRDGRAAMIETLYNTAPAYERVERSVEEATNERNRELNRMLDEIHRRQEIYNELKIRDLDLTVTRAAREPAPEPVLAVDPALNPTPHDVNTTWHNVEVPETVDPEAVRYRRNFDGEFERAQAGGLPTHDNINEAYDRLVAEDAATIQGRSPWLDLAPIGEYLSLGETVNNLGYPIYPETAAENYVD